MIHTFYQIVKESYRNDPVCLFGVQLWFHLKLKIELVIVEIFLRYQIIFLKDFASVTKIWFYTYVLDEIEQEGDHSCYVVEVVHVLGKHVL